MTKQRSRRRPAVSAIFGMILGIGITAAIAGTLIFVVQDQIGISTSGSSIQVSNLSVQRDNDALSITGTIKNTGSTSISEVTINSISVSELDIEQDDTTYILDVGSATFCLDDSINGCAKEVTTALGFSLADAALPPTSSILEGGRTQAFQLKLTSETSPDISEVVRISDNLTLILQFKSGQDVLLSETYQARVRSG